MNYQHAYDVASASAAYAYNVLPQKISDLPAPDAFLRLHDLFFTALQAYAEEAGEKRVPDPSEN